MKDKIVETAFHLFYQNGFHAVGIDVIAGEAGVTRQTLYNHFESRDALILEVIRRRDEWWRTEFKTLIQQRGGPCPLAQLRAIGPALRDWLSDREFKGCLFISAAAEFPNPRDPAHRTAKLNIEAIRATIENVATSADLKAPESFSRRLTMAIQGAIITEVIERQNYCGHELCDLADILIEKHLP